MGQQEAPIVALGHRIFLQLELVSQRLLELLGQELQRGLRLQAWEFRRAPHLLLGLELQTNWELVLQIRLQELVRQTNSSLVQVAASQMLLWMTNG